MKTIAAVFLLLRLSTCAAFAEDLIYVLGAPPKAASHAISYEKAIAATQPTAQAIRQYAPEPQQLTRIVYEQPQNQVTFAAPPVYYPTQAMTPYEPVRYGAPSPYYSDYSSYAAPCQTCPGGACSSGQCNLYSCPYGTCGPGGCSSCGR